MFKTVHKRTLAAVSCMTLAVYRILLELFPKQYKHHSAVQRVMGYAARNQHDQHVTWLLSLTGIRRDMFSSSFEIMALMAQPEDPDEAAFVRQFNGMHATKVGAKTSQRLPVPEFELEHHCSWKCSFHNQKQ